jgi:hypothetical protein
MGSGNGVAGNGGYPKDGVGMFIAIAVRVSIDLRSRLDVEVVGTAVSGIVDVVCRPVECYEVEDCGFLLGVRCLGIDEH